MSARPNYCVQMLKNATTRSPLSHSFRFSMNSVQASLGIGLSFSFIAGLVNAAVNIPSQITTTLKFRSGVIESLRDKDFLKLRGGMLNLTYLLGASVWGAVIMTITAFLLFTVLSFFFSKFESLAQRLL